MKLAIQQLEAHLKQPLSPIYLVSSDEILLVQDAVAMIQAASQHHGFCETIRITIETNTDWENVLQAHTQTLSLFSDRRVIELNFHHTKLTAAHGKILQAYAEHPINNILIIIRTNKVDSKTEKSAWFQSLLKNSIFISIWPIPTNQLPQWIMQRAQKMQCQISRSLAEKFALQAEGNLLAIQQEIEKHFLLQLDNSTETKSLEYHLTDNARFNVFDLAESMIAGNTARSLRILKNLAEEEAEPTFILWALTREIRMLAEMRERLDQGATFASLFNQFHVFEKRQSSLRAFLQKVSAKKCFALLLHAAHIDQVIKGAAIGNVWNEFEKLLVL